MLAPHPISAPVRRTAFNPIPSGEGSFAKLMVLVMLLLAAVNVFAQNSVSLDDNSFIVNKDYDNKVLSKDFKITSSNAITVRLSLEEDAECMQSFTCGGAQNFTLTPSDFYVAGGATVLFNVSLNNTNAGTYKANLIVRPSNGIQVNVPIAIIIGKRQITADLALKPKEYNGEADIEFLVTPNNEAEGDEGKVKLAGSGVAQSWIWHPVGSYGYYNWDPNPNVGRKCVGDIEVRWGWPDGFYDTDVINNYELPPKLVGVPHSGFGFLQVCFVEVTIMQAEWSGNVPEIVATPSSFTYDKNFSLDKIELNGNEQGSWKFKNFAEIVNPHDLSVNPLDEDSVAVWYAVEFAPPEDSSINYGPKQGEVQLIIHKRSFNNNLKYAAVDEASPCGANNGYLTVVAEDANATVFFSDEIQGLYSLRFPVMNLRYGIDNVEYSILSQAYEEDNPNYRNKLSYPFERFLPFRKVAYWIRGKTLTLNFDTTDPIDEAFFGKYDFDYAKTEWYKGKELVYTGRNYSVLGSAGGDYSVILTGKDKETGSEVRFTTCKESGAYPELTPLTRPPAGGNIKLIASSFGSRIVPGGTNFALNTPEGGKVSVYTVAGELVTVMNAVDARTIVKLPNSHKMYIVKLEAK